MNKKIEQYLDAVAVAAEIQQLVDELQIQTEQLFSEAVDEVRRSERLGVAAAEHFVRGRDKDYLWSCEKLAKAKADYRRAAALEFAKKQDLVLSQS